MIDSEVKTKDGREQIKAYTVEEFEPSMCMFRPLQRNHKFKYYATDYMTLDTETSHDGDEDAWIYQWAVKFQGRYIYGRKPSEIIDLLKKLADFYGLSYDKKIICFIHNSSYDIQYLKHFLARYDCKINLLAIDNHSILQVDVWGFRILCSYKLTNMSLAKLAESYATTYEKATGEIDYTLTRYQDSKLTASDWFYMFSDVASQHDGIQGYITAMGYKFAYECPITSTGFVRTACRNAANNEKDWRMNFEMSALDLDDYLLCRQCFMGGVTICNYLYSGVTIRSKKLRHKDFCSSYPARQILDYMPVGQPMHFKVKDMETFRHLLNNYCCVFVIELTNVRLKKGITAPYIPSSKCIGSEHDKELLKVNGKVVYAPKIKIALCELDFAIIERQYKFDENFKVGHMIIFERGEAPKWLKHEVMEYFEQKCTKKDLDEYLYMRAKAFLNSVYGMTATSVLRQEYKLNNEMVIEAKKSKDREAQKKALEKYYKSYNSFMPYQLAIYTTAWARTALFEMIEAVGYDAFLYCDTDSVFYIENRRNRITMALYTEKCYKRAKEAGAFVGKKFLGLPEDEPRIRAFRALHAKCYAMEEYNKKTGQFELKVIIAGIPKASTKWIDGEAVTITNAQELKKIDNLVDGFTFKHCGGTRAIYNERPIETKIINGHKIELASNVIIDNIEKEVSDTMWTHEGLELCNILYSEVV